MKWLWRRRAGPAQESSLEPMTAEAAETAAAAVAAEAVAEQKLEHARRQQAQTRREVNRFAAEVEAAIRRRRQQ